MPTPVEFLDQHEISYRVSGDQFILDECPFCYEERHFYMNRDTGLWDCKKCWETGNIWTLKKRVLNLDPIKSASELMGQEKEDAIEGQISEALVDEYCENLDDNESAINYLLGRGLSKKSIRRFKIGCVETEGKTWLTIPMFHHGKPVNIKFRTLPPHEKAFKILKGHDTPLFNVDHLDPKKPVYVTEGEIDAMTLVEHGYENTVSIPMGAMNFAVDHFDALVVCGKVYLVFDNDQAGRRAVAEVANRLGPERCFYVQLPVKDANDFFKAGVFSKADFEAIVSETKPIGRPIIASASQLYDDLIVERQLRHDDEHQQVRFPWVNVHHIVGTLEPGYLVVLQAVPKIGKTTFALNTCHRLAQGGFPCLFYCMEMSPLRLLERVIADTFDASVSNLTEDDIIMAPGAIGRLPLYMGGAGVATTPEKVFETIRYAVKRFGIKLVVFDHLHFLCRSLDNSVSEVGRVVRDFKLLFEELQVPGILIAHPRKTSLKQVPGMYAARSSGEIPGDCDILIALWREPLMEDRVQATDFDGDDPNQATFSKKTLVRVVASRFSAGGNATLYFTDEGMRFEEALT